MRFSPAKLRSARSRVAFLILVMSLLASGCAVIDYLDDPDDSPESRDFPTPAPTATQEPRVRERWELDRDKIPVRTDWPRSSYHDQYEECRDREFGGRTRTIFTFIDVPPEPHTPEVIRQAVAEHLCYGGKADYIPPGIESIVQGHFTTTEIKEWAGQLDEILAGIESPCMGTGNAENRINYCLIDLADEYEARERLEAAGIPQHAVHFRHSGYAPPDW